MKTFEFEVHTVDSDCALAVSAIHPNLPPLVIDSIIYDIISLLTELSDGSSCYFPPEGNMVAHKLQLVGSMRVLVLIVSLCWSTRIF